MPHMSPRIKAKKGRLNVLGGLTAPLVTIKSPSTGTVAIAGPSSGSPLTHTFSGVATAIDDVLGDISSSVTWTSSLDGALGTGASVSLALTVGTHVITASATDGVRVGTDTITVKVKAPAVGSPPVGSPLVGSPLVGSPVGSPAGSP